MYFLYIGVPTGHTITIPLWRW